MSEPKPVFFFSYARNTPDLFLLDDFFKKLKEEVSFLNIGELETVGFRDTSSIKSGDDWTRAISEAVQTSKVLLCIYTPRFFTSEYCGTEFAAFVKRHKAARYVKLREADGKIKYSVHDTHNIIPVLWASEKDYEFGDPAVKLPPHLVSAIHHDIQETSLLTDGWKKKYQKQGLRLTYGNAGRDIRRRFAKHFAELIAGAKPLPSPDRPLSFEELWDAFKKTPEEYIAEDATPQIDVAESPAADSEPVSPGSGDIVAIEVTTASGGTTGWTLYSGGPTLAAAVAEIAHDLRRHHSHLMLDPGADDFDTTAWTRIQEAANKLAIPILFVDPRCLEQHQAALVRLIEHGWRGGIILPADESDMEAVEKFKDSLPDLKQSHAEGTHIVVRPSSTEMDKFRTSIDSVALEIFGKIADVAQVQQKPPQQKGPDSKPRLSNHSRPKRESDDGQS